MTESRERAALARVEELRAEFERVRAVLADAEAVLDRRVIGLEEYLETLTQLRGPEPAEASGPSEPEPVCEPVVDDAAAPSTARARRVVARRKDGAEVDILGPDYRRIMAVFERGAVTDCRHGKWRWAWAGRFRFRPGLRVRGAG
ncbi:hypothetical protein [Streptomyces sp. NPDC014656]|uniref:hypothetical protein n=1 Tax=Streptomyces sp. NPDC014656 TaxID=3364878 RepID=UPI0036F5EAA6